MKKISTATLCALSLIISTQQTFTLDEADVAVATDTTQEQPKKGSKKNLAKCKHDDSCKSGACYQGLCAKKGSSGYKSRMKAQNNK